MRTLIFLFLFLTTTTIFSQHHLSVYHIKNSSVPTELPSYNLECFRDVDGKITFEDVVKENFANRFRLVDSFKHVLLTPGTYWLHYQLKNATSAKAEIALPAAAGVSVIYTRKTGEDWKKFSSGNFVPWSSRDGFRERLEIPFELDAGQQMEVFQKDVYWHSLPRRLAVTIDPSPQLIKENNFDKQGSNSNFLLTSFISGILLFAALINLRFYALVKEKFYLLYSLFLFSFALLYSPSQYFLREYPYANFYISNISFFIALFFFVHFFRYYFRTYELYKSWDKWLIFISILPVLIFSSVFVSKYILSPHAEFYTVQYGNKSYLLLLNSLLITALLYLPKNRSSAGLWATLPPLIFWGIGQTYLTVYIFICDYKGITLPPVPAWFRNNTYMIDLFSVVWVVCVFSSVLFQRFEKLQKENLDNAVEKERLEKQKEIERSELIEQQKQELEKKVDERTRELRLSLNELKATQKQLIQKEKMASLGELTAGIAHEIQNPLNFVNNFSEVSLELLHEMEDEIKTGNDEGVTTLAKDIGQNLEKILHHGTRADAIVKGMLQHSRTNAGQKELTDLNSLVKEYMNLAYQGFLSKEKMLTITFETDFDEQTGRIRIIPQDIARVLLNLFNNAYYSVAEKKKRLGETYKPLVCASTKKISEDKIEIRIRDNGVGIPERLLEKIFMPFFTTKPTGQGTGLGLSLSYDIITKGHNGTMEVRTQEGEYAEFKIVLNDIQ